MPARNIGAVSSNLITAVSSKEWWVQWLSLGRWKWLLAGTSAITYAFASYMDDKNPWTAAVWRLSALSGLLAFLAETALARRDRKESEQLRSKVAELNLAAEQERLARVKLEAEIEGSKQAQRVIENTVRDRTLTPEQQSRIAEKMRGFSGYRAAVGSYPEQIEASNIAMQIDSALRAARLNSKFDQPMVHGFAVQAHGVFIRTTLDGRSLAAASALAEALNVEGIHAHVGGGLPFADATHIPINHDDPNTFMILVLVGSKPGLPQAIVSKSVAHAAARPPDRRQITDGGKANLKPVLERFPRQKFQIMVSGRDEEAVPFARQMEAVFYQFGWSGDTYTVYPEGDHPLPEIGIGIVAGPKNGDTGWATEIIRDIAVVLREDGIELSANAIRFSDDPIPDETIEITVGRIRD